MSVPHRSPIKNPLREKEIPENYFRPKKPMKKTLNAGKGQEDLRAVQHFYIVND
jgi:hypothetical protein